MTHLLLAALLHACALTHRAGWVPHDGGRCWVGTVAPADVRERVWRV